MSRSISDNMFIEVFTDFHRISGSIDLRAGYLITQLLANEMIRMEQVSVSRISQPGEIMMSRDHSAIKAASINLLIAQKGDAKKVVPMQETRAQVDAFITMANFEIEGKIYTKARQPNTGYLISEQTSIYLDPILQGRATCVNTGHVYEGYLFLIRKEKISMISVAYGNPQAAIPHLET